MRAGPVGMAVVATLAVAAATAVGGDAAARLEVAGGTFAGELVPAPEVAGGTRETFLWRSPRFVEPFEFRIGEVTGIAYPGRARVAAPRGPFVHLKGGDMIAATIESLDADALVVSTAGPAGPQRLRIARGEVAAITRSGAGGASYTGPAGLEGWNQSPADSWREEAGRIMTDRVGATVTRTVATPPRARFEIRLSRRRAAEFRLAVAAAERADDDGYVLQEVGGDAAGGLMLVRRSGGRADIEPAPAGAWRGDTLRVVLFVDQERGRLAAVFPDAPGADGEKVTEVDLRPAGAARLSERFRLELTGGDVCLERLSVGPWLGLEPTLRDASGTTVTTRGGAVTGFTVTSFDAAGGAYVLTREAETRQMPAADVEEIRFPDGDEVAFDPMVRVLSADGCTLAGDLVRIDDAAVWLRRRGVAEVVAVPRGMIAAISVVRPAARRAAPAGRIGTLVAGEDRVRGWLADGADAGLAWRPVGSVNAAAFVAPVDAEVEYAVRKRDKKGATDEVGGIGGLVTRDAEGFYAVAMLTDDGAAARDGRLRPGDRIIAVAPTATARFVETKDLDNETVTHLLRGRIGTVVRLRVTDAAGNDPRDIDLNRGPIAAGGREILELALRAHVRLAGAGEEDAVEALTEYPALVILRSGDVAPCRIEAIDADAVRLRSPRAARPDTAVRVPTSLVKAVELIPSAESRTLDKTLIGRLLTLPRMQRQRPPTHLLRLVNGDYLRGRLVAADERTVTFEMLDVQKRLPRAQVARIIWLHPPAPPADGDAPAVPEAADEGFVVQSVAPDDRRMTISAETVEGNVVRGRSRAFGESSIDLSQVDRLLLGKAVGRDARELPYAKWTLTPAPEPRALGKPAEK